MDIYGLILRIAKRTQRFRRVDFIDENLSVYKVTKDFSYYGHDGECKDLPHLNTHDTKYSIHPKLDAVVISKMQEEGNLIFYDGIFDDNPDSLEFDL